VITSASICKEIAKENFLAKGNFDPCREKCKEIKLTRK
jgi:hypothetical protein